jgi:hypothetical protein
VSGARSLTMFVALIGAVSCASHAAPPSNALVPSRVELGGADVLYVIDGHKLPRSESDSTVPAEVRALAPGDIVSIRVFKGSEARERYGADGENGVVVISTRRRD